MNMISYPYTEFDNIDKIETEFVLVDHICGFDINYKNIYFDKLQQYGENNNLIYTIKYHQILSDNIKNNYSNLKLFVLLHFLTFTSFLAVFQRNR